MKRKVLSILLVSAMCTSLLAGCGGSAENTGASDTTGGSSVEDTQAGNDATDTAEANGDVYNVVMVWPNLTGGTPEGMSDVEAAINEITVPEIGVSVTLEPIEFGNLASETNLAITSGDKIDLVLSVGTGVSGMVNSGELLELDDLYAQYGADITKACGNAVSGGYYNGVLYGIPNAYIQGEKYGMLARTDILEKYNITIDPDKYYTMDDLSEMFATIKAGEGDNFYMVGNVNNSNDMFSFMHSMDTLGATSASGILLLDDDWSNTTIVNEFATDEYAAYAQTMYDWAQAGYISPDAASNTDDVSVLVKSGNYLGQIWYTTGTAATDFGTQTGYDMTAIQMLPAYTVTSRFQNILWSIPNTCENPEKTFQFLNMLYADNEIDTILQFGLEGVTYDVVEQNDAGDKVIKFCDGVDTTNAPYYQAAGVYGDRLSWPIWDPNPIDSNQKLRDFNTTVTNVTPALGYCFVSDPVQSQYTAVDAVIKQYVATVSAGVIDPATELPEFLGALEDAGINDVIAENQKQLDEWLAQQ